MFLAGTVNLNGTCGSPCTVNFPVTFTNHPTVILELWETNNSGPTYTRHYSVKRNLVSWEMDNPGLLERVNYLAIEERR